MRKRMSAIIAFAASLLIIVFVAAPAFGADPQAGKSPVYLFDVAASPTHGAGRLMINVDQRLFVFNGKDFDPNRLYALYYRTAASPAPHLFAQAVATSSGNVHLAGRWDMGLALLTDQGFRVGAAPIIARTTPNIAGTLQSASLFTGADGVSYNLSGFAFPSSWAYPLPGVFSATVCMDDNPPIIDCAGTMTVDSATFAGHVLYVTP